MRIFLSVWLAASVLSFVSGCKSSPCDKKLCQNAQYKENGNSCLCVCQEGYEGETCSEIIGEKFYGNNLQVNEQWKSGKNFNYTTSIYSSNVNQLYISSLFAEFSTSMYPDITGSTTLSIEQNVGGWSTGGKYSAYGVKNNNKLFVIGALRDNDPPFNFIDSVFFTITY